MIAQVLKSYGTDGEVIVNSPEILCRQFEKNEPVFLLFNRLPVPFFIDRITPRGNKRAIVKFDTIDTLAVAEEISGMEIFLNEEGSQTMEDDNIDSIIGFTLKNSKGESVGTVSDFMDFSGNICLCLEGSDTLIPYHEDLLIDADFENRTITLEISEGLL